MDIFAQALGHIPGGRVLDVATGEGSFLRLLADHLASHARIVGVDTGEHILDAARDACDPAYARFARMDACRLGFRDACFDTVAISASLHHLGADAPAALAEMERLLRPGGHFILAEMHCDARTDAQAAAVRFHHWIADVDLALGRPHHHTLSRRELVDRVAALALVDVACYDWPRTETEPPGGDFARRLESILDTYLHRLQGHPGNGPLRRRSREIRRRLHNLPVGREPILLVVARKPSAR